MSEGFSFFGFQIKRKPEKESIKSFAPEINDDGAVAVAAGGVYGTYVDLDGTIRTEAELVSKYREMSLQPEIDKAVNEVVNEAIVNEDNKPCVELVLDELNVNDKIKQIVFQEFNNVLDLLDFRNASYDLFKRWYIDGRHYFHVVIDEKAPQEGIKELRYIDPRKIRKIREVQKKKDPKSDAVIQTTKQEYYMYAERGLNYGSKILSNVSTTGIKISADAIIQVNSGLTDQNNTMGLSYLHPAIKPLNQLRALEDATLIYHLSRAPERRIFNIEIGNLPKMKAEQYLRDLMVKYKNKLAYNAETGEIRDDRRFMTMLEDFWFPKREGKGTTIDTLSGGTALPDLLTSVEYFQDRLYRALQVPITRMRPEASFNLGRATEISRDEVNFSKFIDRLRGKFSNVFLQALEKQLILKKITTPEEWEQIKKFVRFRFTRDNYFAELKESEIMSERMARLREVADIAANKYVSNEWIRRNVLKQNDEEIKKIDQQIAQEATIIQYHPELVQMQQQYEFEQQIANQPSNKDEAKK